MKRSEKGHLIVILMIIVSLMMIALLAAGQSWSFLVRRDAEAELIFRGNEYADAINFYYLENKSYPLDLNVLAEEGGPHRHRYIRKLYKDPIAEDGKWGLLYLSPAGQGFINPWATPGAQGGQLFGAEDFGVDPNTDRTGVRQGRTRDASGLPAGTAALGEQQMEQLRSDKVKGMPIVGVVHKKSETGIKLYNNIASLNDWTFVPDIVLQPVAGTGTRRRGAVVPTGGPGGIGDSQHPIYLDPTKRPGYDPSKAGRRNTVEQERMEAQERLEKKRAAEEERRRAEEERQRWEEEQEEEDSQDEYYEDDEDPNAETDPNAEEADPNAEEDPNSESGGDGGLP